MDDNSPLLKPIKDAFFERAMLHAALLQHEVDEGRMTSAEALEQLTETMSQPGEMGEVIAASTQNQTPH